VSESEVHDNEEEEEDDDDDDDADDDVQVLRKTRTMTSQ